MGYAGGVDRPQTHSAVHLPGRSHRRARRSAAVATVERARRLEAEHDANRPAPEAERGQGRVDAVTAVGVLKTAEVANVAAEPDVVGEESTDAAADVEAEITLRHFPDQVTGVVDAAFDDPD